jgi:hypothetical protein
MKILHITKYYILSNTFVVLPQKVHLSSNLLTVFQLCFPFGDFGHLKLTFYTFLNPYYVADSKKSMIEVFLVHVEIQDPMIFDFTTIHEFLR